MELVKVAQDVYYIVDFGLDRGPAFAAGHIPAEVLELFTGMDEDEDIMEGYFCCYAQGDPDELAQ